MTFSVFFISENFSTGTSYKDHVFSQSRFTCFSGSEVDTFAVDEARYPLFKQAKYIEFEQKPGELLIIPTGWFHQVCTLLVFCLSCVRSGRPAVPSISFILMEFEMYPTWIIQPWWAANAWMLSPSRSHVRRTLIGQNMKSAWMIIRPYTHPML